MWTFFNSVLPGFNAHILDFVTKKDQSETRGWKGSREKHRERYITLKRKESDDLEVMKYGNLK